jgi:hypothetical protein
MRCNSEEPNLHSYLHGNVKSNERKSVSTCTPPSYDIRTSKLRTCVERLQTGTSVGRITVRVAHSSMKASDWVPSLSSTERKTSIKRSGKNQLPLFYEIRVSSSTSTPMH